MRVLNFEDLEERMIKHLTVEVNPYSVGHIDLDPHYKFIAGGVTDITGYPYMGKTLILNEILWNLTESHGLKNLLHLPDSGKPEEVIAGLIQRDTGKTFDKRYPNVITEKEILPSLLSITNNYKILELDKDKKQRIQRPTPKEFWEFAIKEGYNTASIDSWNYMNHEGNGRDTGYLADVLSYRNELADNNKIHFFTIIHPKNPTSINYTKAGDLKPADGYCLMGGSEWNNNSRNLIGMHKDEKESDDYDVYFHKIKPRIVGKTGMVSFKFDIKLQKFYTIQDFKRVYGNGYQEEFEEAKPEPIKPINPSEGMPNFGRDTEFREDKPF